MKRDILQDDSAGIRTLRSLVAGFRIPKGSEPPRAGRVILKGRPVFSVHGGFPHRLPGGDPLPDPVTEFTPQFAAAFGATGDEFRAAVKAAAEVVGVIQIKGTDGSWVSIGTGFLVKPKTPGQRPRLLTAGHVTAYFPSDDSNASVRREIKDPPYLSRAKGNMAEIRVVFDEIPDDGSPGVLVESVVWPHGLWDIAICELAAPPPNADLALEVETSRNWHQGDAEPIFVLGYPLDDSSIAADVGTEDAIGAEFAHALNTKCVSPGLAVNVPNLGWPLSGAMHELIHALFHDASTLHGNSGSPVLSMRTGKVIGLHFYGGRYQGDRDIATPMGANVSAYLPLILEEPRFREEIDLDTAVALRTPPRMDFPPRLEWRQMPTPGLAETSPNARFTAEGPSGPELTRAALQDRPDDRDIIYQPRPATTPGRILPKKDPNRVILNQWGEPACTAFALAACIDQMRRGEDPKAAPVSPRMLYEMAQAHDEWVEDSAFGSSLRGALKGFFHSGVCRQEFAPFFHGTADWMLDRRMAEDSASTNLASYQRVEPRIDDFQAAVDELGAVLVTARIHEGWIKPRTRKIGTIRHSTKTIGTHAFLIVGFDENGFIVQNSWGADWSSYLDRPGMALWKYEDWAENILDAWVIRLAASTPRASGLTPRVSHANAPAGKTKLDTLPRPRRYALLGHIVHVERDRVVTNGRLGLGLAPLVEAALASNKDTEIGHVALVYHDPFFDYDEINRLAAFLTPTLMNNGIWPLHIAYGVDEILTMRTRIEREHDDINTRFSKDPTGADIYLKRRAISLLRPALSAFTAGVEDAAEQGAPLWRAASAFCLDGLRGRDLHLIAVGAGGIAADAQLRHALRERVPIVRTMIRLGATEPNLDGDAAGPKIVEFPLSGTGVEWVDLVSASLDTTNGPRSTSGFGDAEPSQNGSLPELLTDADALNKMVERIVGRFPSPTKGFRAI